MRPFPGPGGKAQISDTGGQLPVWSRNSRELFFQNLDNRIMVTDYTVTEDSFMPDKPHLWSDQRLHEPQRSSELRSGAGRQAVCNIP